jgi:DnaJ-class molecular chaperone
MIENPQNHNKSPFGGGQRPGSVWDQFTRNFQQWTSGFNTGQQNASINFVSLNISFKESCLGAEKHIEYVQKQECVQCSGLGAKEGDYEICKVCGGAGQRISKQGFQLTRTICQPCKGKGIIIYRPCSLCQGKRYKQKKIKQKITIPPCIINGMVYEDKTPDGELLAIELNILKESEMTRPRGTLDIHSKHRLSLKEALLGCKINVQTILGEKTVTVKECTSYGDKLRLKDCGAKHPQQDTLGSHIIHIQIDFPETLTQTQRNLLEEVFSANSNDKQGEPVRSD